MRSGSRLDAVSGNNKRYGLFLSAGLVACLTSYLVYVYQALGPLVIGPSPPWAELVTDIPGALLMPVAIPGLIVVR